MADSGDHIHSLFDIALDSVNAAFSIIGRAHGHSFGDELLAQLDIINHVAVMCSNHAAF